MCACDGSPGLCVCVCSCGPPVQALLQSCCSILPPSEWFECFAKLQMHFQQLNINYDIINLNLVEL